MNELLLSIGVVAIVTPLLMWLITLAALRRGFLRVPDEFEQEPDPKPSDIRQLARYKFKNGSVTVIQFPGLDRVVTGESSNGMIVFDLTRSTPSMPFSKFTRSTGRVIEIESIMDPRDAPAVSLSQGQSATTVRMSRGTQSIFAAT